MAVKPGDFLLVNFTLKVKESGETVDTTYDAVAKDAHLHQHDATYGPRFIILGEGWLPKGLEDSLVGADIGKQTTVELPPEKGYGARDPAKMRLVPLRRFREQGVPNPGAQIELDGRPAIVRAVGAGRVQVDYNHPLAGRTLIYDVSIEKVVEDDNEKVLNIISKRIPEVDKTKFNIEKNGTELTVEVPEEAFYLSGLQIAKRSVTSDIQKYFPDVETISFREVFKKRTLGSEVQETPTPAASETQSVETSEKMETKKATEEGAKPQAQPARKRKTPAAKRPAAKGPTKRAMMGSESQR
jgi:FKBP-type peptidyl-prolyl cis-trans isomerase SlyD